MKRLFFLSCVSFVFFASVLFAESTCSSTSNKSCTVINGSNKTVITSNTGKSKAAQSGYYSEYAENIFFPEEPNQKDSK